jgi:hypothetical protein
MVSFAAQQRTRISEDFPILIKIGLMMASYAHPQPQHMKLVNHLAYVGRRYGNHSMLGLSLSHYTMVSIAGQ